MSEMSGILEELDISWLREQEQLIDIENNHKREPMNIINTMILYVNQQDTIDKIVYEKHSLDVINDLSGSLFHKNKLIEFIHTKKLYTPSSRYKLLDTLLFNIDLNHHQLITFSKTKDVSNFHSYFLKPISFMTDIIVPPSLFVFHKTNSLIFLFQEIPIINSKNKSLKSILKKDSSTEVREHTSNTTKKVKILQDLPTKIKKHKKTRRHF
tara:strand:- start:1454 stop:2086 length:633 start_codon:yes stop_codon:yes gene_type:complete